VPQSTTPRLFRMRQEFERNELADPVAALRDELLRLDGRIAVGARIAIACGSRGIDNVGAIVKEIAAFVRSKGAQPFIVPAMGSHGGATAEGQQEVLRLNGISEETTRAPIDAVMDVVELPQGPLPHRIFMGRRAYDSDGVILINRIKSHTDFHGRYESGLMKMAVIGLGKLEGATAIHDFGIEGLRDMVAPAARQVFATGKILGGIGLVENAFHKTMIVRALTADEIADEEPRLLQTSKAAMPTLPVAAFDVLVIDRMGKNISGVGIDPNITGRVGVRGQEDSSGPQVTAMMVADLTEESHGNAIGVGLADVITRRLYDKVDWAETYRNVITSSFLERGKTPIVAESDRDAFDIARRSCGHIPPGRERIARILDTAHLETLHVSRAIADELRGSPRFSVAAADANLFDGSGTLVPFCQ
jgi:hypothetical protein